MAKSDVNKRTVAEARRMESLKLAVLSVLRRKDGIAQLRDEHLDRIADEIVAAVKRVEAEG